MSVLNQKLIIKHLKVHKIFRVNIKQICNTLADNKKSLVPGFIDQYDYNRTHLFVSTHI